MPVYVDSMRAAFGNMVMSHMVADTDEELHAMADRIGVSRKWHQKPGTHHSHYDIAQSKRALAVHYGAREITRAQLGVLLRRKRQAADAGIKAARIERKLAESKKEEANE